MLARRLRPSLAAALLGACLALAACAPSAATGAPSATPRPPVIRSAASPVAPRPPFCFSFVCAVHSVSLFVEPDAGEAPILSAIRGATSSVWVEVYLLSDRNVVRALEDAASRGVDVRVLLEPHPYGGGDVAAQTTVRELQAAGVQARPSNPAFQYTHAKLLLVDGATAYILTANLSRAGLGGNSTTANRDYGLIDRDSADVAAVKAIFQADWDRTPATLTDAHLVVSPINARPTLAALLDGAHTALWVEDEEMADSSSEQELIAAAQRGVDVRLMLPAPSSSSSPSPDVARLAAGRVHVRYLRAPYMHAKLVLADGTLAFTGSENFSATSLDANRELGLLLADPAALATLTHVYTQDWSLATPAA